LTSIVFCAVCGVFLLYFRGVFCLGFGGIVLALVSVFFFLSALQGRAIGGLFRSCFAGTKRGLFTAFGGQGAFLFVSRAKHDTF
jgi:hypothetical protein